MAIVQDIVKDDRGRDVTIYIEEHGTGKKIRGRLLRECDVHTLPHLPTGIFYV